MSFDLHLFDGIRRTVVFLLGVLTILDALANSTYVIPKLIIGMIMVGILPNETIN